MFSSGLIRLTFAVHTGPLDDLIDYVLGLATIVVIIVTVVLYVRRALTHVDG
jgi:hypothetical protein